MADNDNQPGHHDIATRYHIDNDVNPEYDELYVDLHDTCDDDDCTERHVYVIPVEHVARHHLDRHLELDIDDIRRADDICLPCNIGSHDDWCTDDSCTRPHLLVAYSQPRPAP
jgi:hypothetical protein